jgi:hypothetical protein
MSYYPYWINGHPDYTQSIDDLGNNMFDMAARYGKEVMVVEVGGLDTQVQNTYDMLVAVIKKTMAVPEGKGLGVIYWEQEGERTWSGGYPLSCWGSNGKPAATLDAFLTNTTGLSQTLELSGFAIYPNPCSGGKLNFKFRKAAGSHHIRIFDISGRLIEEQTLNETTQNSIRINLLPGTYLVKVDSGNHSNVSKLLVK